MMGVFGTLNRADGGQAKRGLDPHHTGNADEIQRQQTRRQRPFDTPLRLPLRQEAAAFPAQ